MWAWQHAFVTLSSPRAPTRLAKAFADVVIPQEYGITERDKVAISTTICHHLFRKLSYDFLTAYVASTW